MRKRKLCSKKVRRAARRRARKAGLFEKIVLKSLGRRDGKKSLPRQKDNGSWFSPFMDRKVRAFAMFGDNLWTLLQREQEEKYIQIENLNYAISQKQSLLDEKCQALEQQKEEKSRQLLLRKEGEDQLSDTVIKSRRAAEFAKDMEPARQEILSLTYQIRDDIRDLALLCSSIHEECNTIRMVCHGCKDSMMQRLDIYWDAALKSHPDKDRMSVIPEVTVVLEHEEKYMEMHKYNMLRAEKILERYADHADREVA